MSDGAKDRAVLRFMLTQDGWVTPGRPEVGRLHQRVWGKGPEKIMPANGRELIAGDAGYREALEALDALVVGMSEAKR
jgi:hypothetical protein